MSKEKLVYILNPDGLTESIFVAKGEPNEGQYRGKRFTKAGWKAEKKRLKDEMLAQAHQQSTTYVSPANLDELSPAESADWVKSLEEYEKSAETSTIQIVSNNIISAAVEGKPKTTYESEISKVVSEPETFLKNKPSSNNKITYDTVKNDTVVKGTVRVVGTVKGAVFVINSDGVPLFFRDFPTGFVSKTELLEKLTLTGLKYPKIEYVETENGDILFTGTAEMF